MLVQSPESFLGLRVAMAVTRAPLSLRAASKWVIPMKPMPIMPMRIMWSFRVGDVKKGDDVRRAIDFQGSISERKRTADDADTRRYNESHTGDARYSSARICVIRG